MTLPTIEGIIKRRLLINYRVAPEVVQSILPEPFRPQAQRGYAIAGICLIRLEQLRPVGLPALMGIASENAAHRFAVEWTDNAGDRQEGVFIPKRSTDSNFNRLAGGRLFPGEHESARFCVTDSAPRIEFSMRSENGETSLDLVGIETEAWPESSCFASLQESSSFFEKGRAGYSLKAGSRKLDGLELQTMGWQVLPLRIEQVRSSYFDDRSRFPEGSIEFDHALIMRELPHRWHSLPQWDNRLVPRS